MLFRSLPVIGGKDGLDVVHRIIHQAYDRLQPKGRLVCEIGDNRKALLRLFPRTPFNWPATAAGTGQVFLLQREDLPRGENVG